MSGALQRRTLLGGIGAIIAGGTLGLPEIAEAKVPVTASGLGTRSLLSRVGYPAYGTVFTRSVANMPLASNSSLIAKEMPLIPSNYCGKAGFGWLVTSVNTTSYNIPFYVVDSTKTACPKMTFKSTDPRIVNNANLVKYTLGSIPFPTYGVPAGGGDMSFAVYDQGAGIMREYFHAEKDSTGAWVVAASGYAIVDPGLAGMAAKNFWMQLAAGSSSVVGMLNPLSQVGIAEARVGEINHALSFTIAEAREGFSFPARQGDGRSTNPNYPYEGQWFRFPPTLNLDTLGLTPMSLLLAKAVQKYGGYAADRNLWCHAFNLEHPQNEIKAGRPDPWASGGDLFEKYWGLKVNDFPWHLTQWAPKDWKGTAQVAQPTVIWDDNYGLYFTVPSGTVLHSAKWVTSGTTKRLVVTPVKTLTSALKVRKYSRFYITNSVASVSEVDYTGYYKSYSGAASVYNLVQANDGSRYYVKDATV